MNLHNAGLWAGIENANVYENGVYLTPGIYDLEVVRCISKKTREKGDAFIVEFEVLSTSTSDHPVGSKRTWYQKMVDISVGHGAVAGFLMGCFDLDNNAARKVDFFPYLGSFMPRVDGPENILSGIMVRARCTQITTVKKGQPFTKHDWEGFDYPGMGLTAPVWDEYRDRAGSPMMPPAAPSGVWTPPPGATVNGKLYWAPGMADWAPIPVAGPPPLPRPAGPPPLPRPAFTLPPGATVNGKLYWAPGMADWAPIPG